MTNVLLLIAKAIILIYFLAYSLIHIAVYLTPKTANFLVFQNYRNYFARKLFLFLNFILFKC